MKRIVLAVAMIAVGVTAVVAQSDPIAARKALMKANNDNARNLVRITRGKSRTTRPRSMRRSPNGPRPRRSSGPCSPTIRKTGETRATPKVWETRSDFNTKIAEFAKAVADNRDKAKNVDEVKVALAAVGKTCDGCHEQYRARQR